MMGEICEGCEGTPCICIDDGFDRIPPNRYDFKLESYKKQLAEKDKTIEKLRECLEDIAQPNSKRIGCRMGAALKCLKEIEGE
jgi:hypothetical protein